MRYTIIDMLASKDNDIINRNIAIGIEVDVQVVAMDKIYDFDDKAYDIGIKDKVLVVVPGLSRRPGNLHRDSR